MTGRTLALAWTIARRDYRAAVWSRLFLLFLLLPLVLGVLGLAFGALGAARDGAPGTRPTVAVTADLDPLAQARAALASTLGEAALPPLVAADGPPVRMIAQGHAAVLTGGIARPRLLLGPDAPGDIAGDVALIVDAARRGAPTLAPVTIEQVRPAADEAARAGRLALAQGVQYAILVLTVMLAGRLLSSFIEERASKVIEVLAAAVPVEAIFLGKLAGMLLFSLTCVAGWGVVLLVSTLAFAPQLLAGMAAPAVGWPAFVLLSLFYFSTTYLLLGAVLLGLGAHANSPADVQTLALPTTMAQLALFALASFDVGRPNGAVAQLAAWVPWSSALAMAARAAELPALWPHALAILWQAAWLALTVRLASRRFRRAVLKSGPPRRRART